MGGGVHSPSCARHDATGATACPCELPQVEPECFCSHEEAGAKRRASFGEMGVPAGPARRHGSFAEAGAAPGAPAACDACPFCGDVCGDADCPDCRPKRARPRPAARGGLPVFTACEVRRHASAASCWLVAGRDVFDCTAFLPRHPAGTKSIVRNAGGRDCAEDLGFHSAKAQKLWYKHRIGRLAPCASERGARTADDGKCVVS